MAKQMAIGRSEEEIAELLAGYERSGVTRRGADQARTLHLIYVFRVAMDNCSPKGYSTMVSRRRTYRKSPMCILNPPHPGSFIRTEVIEPLGLSVSAAARAIQVSRPTLSTLLNGKADLSGEMALRLEKAFGADMETLMRMQSSYDIARTRRRESSIRVSRYTPAVLLAESGRAGHRS